MQKEFYESLGFALRKARKRQGFKQPEIAKRMGVSVPMISYWERGLREMKAKDLKLYCQIIGVSVQSIVDQT